MPGAGLVWEVAGDAVDAEDDEEDVLLEVGRAAEAEPVDACEVAEVVGEVEDVVVETVALVVELVDDVVALVIEVVVLRLAVVAEVGVVTEDVVGGVVEEDEAVEVVLGATSGVIQTCFPLGTCSDMTCEMVPLNGANTFTWSVVPRRESIGAK